MSARATDRSLVAQNGFRVLVFTFASPTDHVFPSSILDSRHISWVRGAGERNMTFDHLKLLNNQRCIPLSPLHGTND